MSKNKGLTNLEIVLIIVVIILVYVITIGYVNLLERLEEKEERTQLREFDDKENKDEKIILSKLKYRHKRLKEIISKNEEINNKLNKRFKLIYNSVKVIFVLLFLGFVATLYLGFGITDISNLLTWIGAFAILITVVSYLAFDSFNGVTDFNNSIKMKLESSISSKCISIEEKLPIYREEEKMLAEAISIQEKEILISNIKVIDNNTFSIEKKDDIA